MTDDEGYIWVGSYKKLVRLSPDLSEVKSYDSSLPVTSVNMVYKDEALGKLMNNGEYDKIYDKWFADTNFEKEPDDVRLRGTDFSFCHFSLTIRYILFCLFD